MHARAGPAEVIADVDDVQHGRMRAHSIPCSRYHARRAADAGLEIDGRREAQFGRARVMSNARLLR